MAIFERKINNKIILDDTKPLLFEFTDVQIINGHTEYSIELYRDPDFDEKWTVKHRYSDFAKLHSSLKTPTINLPELPPKKVFGNTDKDFINERKESLKDYLEKLMQIPYVSTSLLLRRFLNPDNYEGNYLEEARQNLLIALRSGGSHEVTQPIPCLGSRIRKFYFVGYPLSNPKLHHILWWAPFGPDRIAHLRDIHATLTTLLQCRHVFIVSAVSCVATESGVCIIRPWFSQGSLRDYIYGVKPQFDSILKYTNNKRRDIPIKTCAVYGRQILEALAFLHGKGIAHGSIHSGNVVIENNVCKLLDIENQVLGLPHFLRHYMTKIKKINSMESIDIYCFGHLLYEMVFHNPLESEFCDKFSHECPPLCRSVLESILSSEACKNGLPSAEGLLTHPYFNEVPLLSYEKPSLKLSSTVKETLNLTYETILRRLKEDQKKVKTRRQKLRADAILSGVVVRNKCEKKSNPNPINDSVKTHLHSDSVPVSDSQEDTIDTIKPSFILAQTEPEERDSSAASGDGTVTPTDDRSLTPTSAVVKNDLLYSISSFDKNTLKKRNKN